MDKRFGKDFDFDPEFRGMKKMAMIGSVFSLLLTVTGVVAVGYIAYKVLVHFGII